MYGICRARTDAVRGMLESGLGSSFPGGLSHRNGMGRGSRERKRAGKGLGMGMGLRPGRPSGTAFFGVGASFPDPSLPRLPGVATSENSFPLVSLPIIFPRFFFFFSPPLAADPPGLSRERRQEPACGARASLQPPSGRAGSSLGRRGGKKIKKNRSSSLLTAQIISS